ncbi:hypothetical protein EMCRGX_G024030 [Ephydatia muelleri]
MSSIKKHLSGCEKRRRKVEVEASVSQHPKISSFFSTSTLTTATQSAATGSSPLLTADQFPSEPFGSSSTADGNTVTVVTHHVSDLFSAVVHTEPATEAPPACIEESFQVPESIQMDNSQCKDVTETVHQDGAVFLHQMETDPALWSISENMIQYWLRVGPELCRNRDGVYTNSTRQGKSIRGRGNPSYLSSTICEEFVLLMAEEVRQVIINEIASAKYYSFSVDSTPDISHTDQLTFTVRYVHDAGIPTERFLKFEEIHSHTGLNLFNTLIDILKDFRLDLKDCRGQSYDNASNMSGKYSGVQARVLEENNKASYIPCMAHSLNLSGVSAEESCVNAVSFFGFVEKLYAFFSASTHRWNLLRTVLSAVNAVERSLLPKRLCETRWSSRSDALKSLSQHYKCFGVHCFKEFTKAASFSSPLP